MEAAPRKRVPGKPFTRGADPRRNVTGAQKGRSVTAILRAKLAEQVFPESPITKGEMVADMLLGLAMKGDLGAMKEVLDRSEGKSVARTETGDPGAFEELAGKSVDELRAMLKAVK